MSIGVITRPSGGEGKIVTPEGLMVVGQRYKFDLTKVRIEAGKRIIRISGINFAGVYDEERDIFAMEDRRDVQSLIANLIEEGLDKTRARMVLSAVVRQVALNIRLDLSKL